MSGRPPFSHRYGIADHREVSAHLGQAAQSVEELWRSRHTPLSSNLGDLLDPVLRCVCPGWPLAHVHPDRRRCSQLASGEDRLCGPCREHCLVGDAAGRDLQRIVDLFGPSSQGVDRG